MAKGDKNRIGDKDAFDANYDLAFRNKSKVTAYDHITQGDSVRLSCVCGSSELQTHGLLEWIEKHKECNNKYKEEE